MWYLKTGDNQDEYVSSVNGEVETVENIKSGARAFKIRKEAKYYKDQFKFKLSGTIVENESTYIKEVNMKTGKTGHFRLTVWITGESRILEEFKDNLNVKERKYLNKIFKRQKNFLCDIPFLFKFREVSEVKKEKIGTRVLSFICRSL